MKITNIRVKNNYKVKLTNSKLAGVNAGTSVVAEQGTRTPVIPTPPAPPKTFQEKYDIVMKYLIGRYEPGWSAADPVVGKAATMSLLGVSAGINPLILGGTAQSAFQYAAYPGSSYADGGWFDPLTHPKDFAAAVKSAYKVFERARSPQKAKHRFVDYQLYGIGDATSSPGPGGNMFFNFNDFMWYPDTNTNPQKSMGLTLNYNNSIERVFMQCPYGHFGTPMSGIGGLHKRSFPWISDRYTHGYWRFDSGLLLRESTTMRDLLNDVGITRDPFNGVVVDGVTDAFLNESYRNYFYPAGHYTATMGDRSSGGFTGGVVSVGSPWIRYPQGLTWSDGWWGGNVPGLCFNKLTLQLFDGTTFPTNPQEITDRPVPNNTIGISYGFGEMVYQSLNDLSSAWGNSMEFIGYLGGLPYGTEFESMVPWALFRDPTVAGNTAYFNWRLDASVSHWKEKFRSPIDGFAHVFMDASSLIERTFHRYQPNGFTAWKNIASNGVSFVENIPVTWARKQFNDTYGSTNSNGNTGVVLGIERFAHYMFMDDGDKLDPNSNNQRKSPTDTLPRH